MQGKFNITGQEIVFCVAGGGSGELNIIVWGQACISREAMNTFNSNLIPVATYNLLGLAWCENPSLHDLKTHLKQRWLVLLNDLIDQEIDDLTYPL